MKGIDKTGKAVTVLADVDSFERIRDREASLIVALPISVRKPVKVKKRSGAIQEFDLTQITESMKNAGVGDELAEAVARIVGTEFAKRASPVPTKRIKEAVIKELIKRDPKAARLFEKYRKKLSTASWAWWFER
ncbi:MAG: ATP cone domain-containing protein [Candidatus Bathyarchaeia archaeon]